MKKAIKFISVAMVVIMLCLTLASCDAPNADPDKALSSLKENGISWAAKDDTIKPGLMKLAGIDGVECVVSGTGKIDGEFAHVTIIYFYKAEDAQNEWEDVQKYAEDDKDDAKESDWVFKKSGKMIYYGTKDAVKAAK